MQIKETFHISAVEGSFTPRPTYTVIEPKIYTECMAG